MLASILATAVDILYINGWSCSEYIGYSCRHIVVGGVLASIPATAVDILYNSG